MDYLYYILDHFSCPLSILYFRSNVNCFVVRNVFRMYSVDITDYGGTWPACEWKANSLNFQANLSFFTCTTVLTLSSIVPNIM